MGQNQRHLKSNILFDVRKRPKHDIKLKNIHNNVNSVPIYLELYKSTRKKKLNMIFVMPVKVTQLWDLIDKSLKTNLIWS